MGGIIVAKGVTIAMIVDWIRNPWQPAIHLTGLIIFVGFTLIGFVDDFVVPRMMPGKRGLGWKQKMGMQIVLATVAAYVLFGGFTANAALFAFMVLFFSNAYNFADGLDGLAGSLLLGLGVGIIALDWLGGTRFFSAIWVAPLLGGIIPFLFINAPPARVFMGDVGSLPIGALLGASVSTLYIQQLPAQHSWKLHSEMLIPIAIISVMMIAELVPVPLQIFSVKVFKKKIFPFTPIHHAFEKAGWKETRVTWTFALWQLVLSGAAITAYIWLTK